MWQNRKVSIMFSAIFYNYCTVISLLVNNGSRNLVISGSYFLRSILFLYGFRRTCFIYCFLVLLMGSYCTVAVNLSLLQDSKLLILINDRRKVTNKPNRREQKDFFGDFWNQKLSNSYVFQILTSPNIRKIIYQIICMQPFHWIHQIFTLCAQ
jgi:hypothetical protein